MKKRMGLVALLSVFLSSMFLVLASSSVCDLSVQLLSQDPFPAVTGEYVKLVFQINGLENHECGTVSFQLLDKYPLSFDNNSQSTVELNSGIYIRNFPSYAIVAHKVRVDSNALDGENLIETIISKKDSSSELYQFNISVEDTRADFEVYVRDFNFATNKIVLEILNIASVDVEAVTIEIINDNNLFLKGAKSRIVGDLDSNEYTTAEFEINPKDTEISLNIHYTDSAGIRRTAFEKTSFQPYYFLDRKSDSKSSSSGLWIVIVLILGIGGFWFYRRKKKKNR